MKKSKSITATEARTGIKLSPQQIMLSALIQASDEELQRIIDNELEKNVALESDDSRSVDEMTDEPDAEVLDDYAETEDSAETNDNDEVADLPDFSVDDLPVVNNRSDEKEYSPLTNYGSDTSFRESLQTQLSELDITPREEFLAKYIVESLEDDGYLRRSLSEMATDLAWRQHFDTTEAELEQVLLEVVQANLEPVGIGARDLRECLLLQLYELPSSDATMKACQVLEESFDDFKEHRFDRLKEQFGLSDHDINAIQKVVHRLNPRPGGMGQSTDIIDTRAAQVRPDFIVSNQEGVLVVSLCNSRVPAVRISPDYNEMLESISHENLEREDVRRGMNFIEKGIRSGQNFIDALIMRRNTLLAVMRAIVKLQYIYFLSGNIEDLRPMTLKDVAALSHFDISTISRATQSRFVQTDFGIFAIKQLFTAAVVVDGDKKAVSNATIKSALKEIIDNEDKHNPLTDDDLVERLAAAGYKIARRTVVKYRDALGILKSNLRKIN